MKRRLNTIIVISLILTLGAGIFSPKAVFAASDNELVIGTESGFEPFDYLKNGEIVGFDIDLANEIAKDQGKELRVEDMAFDGLITALQAGRVDMVVAGLSVTEDRAKSVNFSDPYYEASQMIIVRKDNLEIKTKADLENKRIGVQLGTTGDEMVDDVAGAIKVQFPSVPAVLQELINKRIDAVVLDNAPAERYLRNRPELRLLEEKLSNENYAIAIHKDNPELLRMVNKTIARVKEDGTYDQMMVKYFSDTDDNEQGSGTMTWRNIFLDENRYMMLVNGLGITLLLALLATVGGIVFGLLAALLRISRFYPFKFLKKSKLAQFNPLSALSKLYTTVIRGTPLLVQLLIFYYVVFGQQRDVSKVVIAALAFAINSGAYIAEILRAGFQSLPKGQWEAADSLGFSYVKTIRYIVMPQVLKSSLPSLMNEFITLIKETSVVGWIGLSDLMRGADNIRFQTATAFESLLVAALIYLLLTTMFTRIAARVERKLKVSD